MSYPTSSTQAGADPHWARLFVRLGAGVALVAALIVMGLIALSPSAAATGGSGGHAGGYGNEVVPGSPCIGQEGKHGHKNGKPYKCWQKPGEDCPRWHRVIVSGEPTGKWSSRPAAPCPQCPSPSPSSASPKPSSSSVKPSASTSTSTSTPPSVRPSVSASVVPVPGGGGNTGANLPVTGPALLITVGAGVALLAVGWLLRRAGRIRRTIPDAEPEPTG